MTEQWENDYSRPPGWMVVLIALILFFGLNPRQTACWLHGTEYLCSYLVEPSDGPDEINNNHRRGNR